VEDLPEEGNGLTREEIYRDIIEKYGPGSHTQTVFDETNGTNGSRRGQVTSMEQKEYIELFIYIISGVFLIFFMEQILKLGSMLKK
jgi:hypothetical protein